MRWLDPIANALVIIAVGVFLTVLIRGEFRGRSSAPYQDMVGSVIHLPKDTLRSDRSSLLLVLSTSCHFCRDSLPFYKGLVSNAAGHVNVIVVAPQTVEESKGFLLEGGLDSGVLPRIVSADFAALGIQGTPTVLLVGRTGKVEKAWSGLLSAADQQDVIRSVTKS